MKGDVAVGAASFALSLAVNAFAIYSADHAEVFSGLRSAEVRMREARGRREEETLRFEFVEAPPKAHPRKPQNAKKIAARDALNQDMARSGASDPASAPATARRGISDQLAQERGAAAAASQPRVEPPAAEKPPAPPAPPVPPKDASGMVASSAEDFQAPAAPEEPRPQPPASSPSAPSRGLTGADRITTEESGRAESRGASLFGVTSFEATGSGMGEYMKNLKEKIWLAWYPYIAFNYPSDFKSADAVVSITLDRDGRVAIVRVVDSYGSPVFASFCLKAVQEAAPFGPLPPEILALVGKDELEIKFGFHYR